MKFFVPECADSKNAEREYQVTIGFLAKQDIAVTNDRIFRLLYRHQDEELVAQVGKESTVDGEIVMAICAFGSGSFAICTRKRGWDYEHVPIYTGSNGDDVVLEVEPFGRE